MSHSFSKRYSAFWSVATEIAKFQSPSPRTCYWNFNRMNYWLFPPIQHHTLQRQIRTEFSRVARQFLNTAFFSELCPGDRTEQTCKILFQPITQKREPNISRELPQNNITHRCLLAIFLRTTRGAALKSKTTPTHPPTSPRSFQATPPLISAQTTPS